MTEGPFRAQGGGDKKSKKKFIKRSGGWRGGERGNNDPTQRLLGKNKKTNWGNQGTSGDISGGTLGEPWENLLKDFKNR